MQSLVNLPITIPFLSTGLVTGLTTFSSITLVDGTLGVYSPTYAEIGSGLYNLTFTPLSTGLYTIFIEEVLLPSIEVVSKTLSSQLQDISDENLGSWQWDKTTGILQLYRLD